MFKNHKVTLIPGDGIGPEIIESTVRMIEATGVKIEWDEVRCGEEVKEKEGTVCPDSVLEKCKENKLVLKGPMIVPKGGSYVTTSWSINGRLSTPMTYPSVNNTIRRALGCSICLRLAKSFIGVPSKYDNVDTVVVRELTEDVYIASEYSVPKDWGVALKVTTEKAVRRACEFGFNFAKKNNRKKVTIVHKANVLKQTDGMFLEISMEVAKKYSEIEYEDLMVDAAAAKLILHPENFDVIITSNQYGDIISDMCAAIVGGLGMSGGANIGEEVIVYEASHGAAPDIANKGIANPTAMMLSGILLLKQLGEQEAADKCQEAIEATLKEGKNVTPDLGGSSSTREYTNEIIKKIKC